MLSVQKTIQHAETAERAYITAVRQFGADADESANAFVTMVIADAKAQHAARRAPFVKAPTLRGAA